mmetsp:Transcript_49686/g.155496  ORF Transcript_49686/g.155496 Transcript_49686/m.155496 type:complete len:94 (-) Transcript_49686:123-404(-)
MVRSGGVGIPSGAPQGRICSHSDLLLLAKLEQGPLLEVRMPFNLVHGMPLRSTGRGCWCITWLTAGLMVDLDNKLLSPPMPKFETPMDLHESP